MFLILLNVLCTENGKEKEKREILYFSVAVKQKVNGKWAVAFLSLNVSV